MSMMVSGMNVRHIKDLNGNIVGTVSTSKPKKSSGIKLKKKLPYNFKKISAQLMQSKKSSSVGPIIVKARSSVVTLKRKLKTGEYDETELTAAIMHAERILRVAKKRLKHMQAEERAENGMTNPFDKYEDEENVENKPEDLLLDSDDFELSSEEIDELIKKIQEEMPELLEDTDGLDELADSLQFMDDMEPEDLDQLKQKHRQEELRDIVRADTKYLKAIFEKLAKDSREASAGVSLQLNGAEVPVTEAPMPVIAEGCTIDETV